MKKIFFLFFFLYSVSSFAQDRSYTPTSPLKDPPFPKDTTYPIYDLTGVKIQPAFPGGQSELFNFLKQNISYPPLAKKNNVQGKVFITFVIDRDGYVTNIEIYKGVNTKPQQQPNVTDSLSEKQLAVYAEGAKQLNEEALRVIRIMPKWSPGMLDDKPVRVRYILPINFKLT